MKAIFLDRDGTIIIDKHYLHDPDQVEYFTDSFAAMKKLQEAGYELFVVTNQSGVGRGYFPIEDVYKVHDRMLRDMQEQGLKPYLDIAVSPHTPDDNSDYRKPGPQMILDLAGKHGINLSESYMLGDKISDAQAGVNAGCKGILVRKLELEDNGEFPFFETLMSFTDSVI